MANDATPGFTIARRALGVALAWAFVPILTGCSPTLRVEMAPTADRVRWEQEITTTVNDHDVRLQKLEAPHADSSPH